MVLPIYKEIDFVEPIKIFNHFAMHDGAIFLDSAKLMDGCGRYSFIAIDPFLKLRSKDGAVYIDNVEQVGDPFVILKSLLQQYQLQTLPNRPPFQGGAAGFLSYELLQHIEKIPLADDRVLFSNIQMGFYDLVIAFDIEKKTAGIFSSGFPRIENRESYAIARLHWLMQEMQEITDLSPLSTVVCADDEIQADFSRVSYVEAINRVKEYILAGDIFEANLTQRFYGELPQNLQPFDLYRRLRHWSSAPFSAYLHFGDEVIASASPERFLQLREKHVETRPIKGTRPRGRDAIEDTAYMLDLQQSEKDHAENVMIVDLLRNDLSRVCEATSVQVPQLCGLESYTTVHHLVSVVKGKLKNQYDAIDLLQATFPGGSITGAPKVRSMEIISELEPIQRGPYCGSVGYIGFNGDMDTSITIRTLVMKDKHFSFQAGGAIVLDSDAEEEYLETLTKAKALRLALTQVI